MNPTLYKAEAYHDERDSVSHFKELTDQKGR